MFHILIVSLIYLVCSGIIAFVLFRIKKMKLYKEAHKEDPRKTFSEWKKWQGLGKDVDIEIIIAQVLKMTECYACPVKNLGGGIACPSRYSELYAKEGKALCRNKLKDWASDCFVEREQDKYTYL